MSGPDAITNSKNAHEPIPVAPVLTPNERALAYAMLHGRVDSINRYKTDPTDGMHILEHSLTNAEWPELVRKFEADPKDTIATARLNIFNIRKDTALEKKKQDQRIGRYVRAFLDLQVKLDIAAFPDIATPQLGVPAYIPHGLIDMGSDATLNPDQRSREMLRVDKRRMFAQMNPEFLNFFTADIKDSSSDKAKFAVVDRVAKHIYHAMPYDREGKALFTKSGDIIEVHDVFKDRLALCRHHALYAQVMLQTSGLMSRVMKCDLDIGDGKFTPHAANLVRINTVWHLLDVTNPDGTMQKGHVFLVPLPGLPAELDLKTLTGKEWPAKRDDGRIWKYRPRNDMHYTIRHRE